MFRRERRTEETPDGDELRGGDQPPLRVPAAQQGLDMLQGGEPVNPTYESA
jgi:hypothetical protein